MELNPETPEFYELYIILTYTFILIEQATHRDDERVEPELRMRMMDPKWLEIHGFNSRMGYYRERHKNQSRLVRFDPPSFS